MTALVTTLGAAVLVGALLDGVLGAPPGAGVLERLGRALMLGLGALGIVSLLADATGLGVDRATVGAASGGLVLLLGALVLRRARRERGADGKPASAGAGATPTTSGERALVVLLLLLAAVGVGLAVRSGWLRPVFQFDAMARWMLKAKALFHEGTLLGPISTDPEYAFTHQRYPPLVSHVANLPALVSGRFDDRIASAVFPWFAVSLVAVAYGAVARRGGALAGAVAAVWIAHLPLLSYLKGPPPGAGAASAMADVPLALFVTGATLAACDAVEGRRAAWVEAGLLAGCAALTKNEGLPLLAGLLLGVLLAAPARRWRAAATVAGLGAVVFAGAWGWIAAGLPALDENYPARLTLDAVTSGLERLGTVLPALGSELVNVPAWNVTWPAVLALLLLGGRALLARGPRLIAVVVAVQLGAYVLAYVVTAWSSPMAEELTRRGMIPSVLDHLLGLTLGRLLVHVAPLAICLGLIVSPPRAARSA